MSDFPFEPMSRPSQQSSQDPMASPIRGRVDGQFFDASTGVYTPKGLGKTACEGICIGPGSEIPGIFVWDDKQFTANNPLHVTVGQPYPGRVQDGAKWCPAKVGYTGSTAGGLADAGAYYEIFPFRQGEGTRAMDYHQRGLYTKQAATATSVGMRDQFFFVGGRKKVRVIFTWTDSATKDLSVSMTLYFYQPSSPTQQGVPGSFSVQGEVVNLVVPMTGVALVGKSYEMPFISGGASGCDAIEFRTLQNADLTQPAVVLVQVQAED